MNRNWNPNPNKLIESSSAVAFLIGLVYGVFLLVKNSFLYYDIRETEVQILAVLLATGLLGSVLNFILKKHVKNIIDEHVKKNLLLKIVDEEIQIYREEALKEEIANKTDESNDLLNTVIVPVQKTLDNVIENLFYECPEGYQFKKDLNYIAFYKSKKIVGYGRLKYPPSYNTPSDGRKVFAIEEFIKKEIPHLRKGAFVQNKMYCNIEKLKSATTTDQIRI